MNKKLIAAGLAAGALTLLGATPSQANCSDGGSWAVDENGNATGSDTIQETPNGSIVYSDGATYAGVRGGTGFIEANQDGVEGSTADGSVNGQVGSGGVCVNDTSAP